MRRLSVILAFMVVAPVGWLEVAPAASGPAGTHQAMGDFNGDGFDDMAVGAPNDNESGVDDSGAVNVLYGGSSGLSDVGNQLWFQDAGTLQDPPEANDGFGGPVMAGDFNGDGYDDLAISAPLEDLGTVNAAGVVHILFGGDTGLTADGDQFLFQGQDDMPGQPVESAFFGISLAAGDINGDGRDDLAVGALGDEINGISSGSVHVLYGSVAGLATMGSQRIHQGSPGVADRPNDEEGFGFSLALANFGRGPAPDLAVGVPGEGVGGESGGAVAVLYSARGRIRTAGDQLWHQDRPGIPRRVREADLFGFSLAAGNLGGSLEAELAIGVPGERAGSGVVHVLKGGRDGLSARGNQLWHQGTPRIAGDPAPDDGFGTSLVAGSFGRSRHADLAVGVPHDEVPLSEDAGAVNVIYGRRGGLSARGSQLWHQGKVPGDLEEMGDSFGLSMAVGNFGNGPRDDLAIGAPGEDSSSGVVLVLHGGMTGLSVSAAQYWDQDSTNILGTSGSGDIFGFFGPCIPF